MPVQVQCTILDAWGWCTGTTQRDGMGREDSSGGWRPQAEAPAAKQPLFIPLAVCAWAFSHWVPVETDSSLLSSAKVSDPMGSEPHLYFYLFILYFLKPFTYLGFPGGSDSIASAYNAGLQDWKSSVFIPIPKKGNVKQCSNYHTTALISHINNAQNSPSQASTVHEP